MRGVLRAGAAAACAAAALATALVPGGSSAQSRHRASATATPAASAAATTKPAASPAATLYALNCMGCHPSPKTREHDTGPLRGEFFHSNKGRNFFIRMPAEGRHLSAVEEARLLDELFTWKRACAAIRQDAPMVEYRGERFVR